MSFPPQICAKVVSGEFTEMHDTDAESAYAYGGNQWVGYDNKASTKVKVGSCTKVRAKVYQRCVSMTTKSVLLIVTSSEWIKVGAICFCFAF